jgi:hypothetical protein
MSIHKLDNGTCVIASGGLWLPGRYEDERTARFAFRLPNKTLVELRNTSIARGGGVITWGDIAKAADELRAAKKKKTPPAIEAEGVKAGCPAIGEIR